MRHFRRYQIVLRLLYLAPWFPYPLDTGSRTRVYYLLRSLAESHRVTLLSLNPQGWAPAQMDAIASICEQVAVVPQDPFRRNWLRMATRFLSLRPVVAAPFREMIQLVNDLHADQPFDAVIAGTVIMAPYALTLSDVTRILEEHNSGTRWMHERYKAQTSAIQRLRCWVSWRKAIRYESQLFRHFDLVTMVSEMDAAISRTLVPNDSPPVAFLPNGVDCAQWRWGLAKPQPDTLVFSGALNYHANYEAMRFFLAEVYPLIRSVLPNIRLRITGSVEGVDLSALLLDESVTFTGFVDDIRPEIAGAWVSVVPIRSGGGTRIKIVEAMALGTPIVSTTKGAEGIAARHGEHLLLADDPATFADYTVRLLQDIDLRQHLTAHARQLVETSYDWSSIGRQFVTTVEQTVANRLAWSQA